MDSPHSIQTLIEAFAIATVAILALVFFRNRVIRKRMAFTLFVIAGIVALHFAADYALFGISSVAPTKIRTAETILVALALISTFVALAFNPWFADRVRDRAPAIVQDTLVIGIFLVVLMGFYEGDIAKLFATSAIAAAILGFALQETLGNAFAGLAIQTEKPFKVGHWVGVAGHLGRVTEVTWRATKIRTKDGNLVILPNNVVAREAINNYTEPTAPSRLSIDVGLDYGVAPNRAADALLTAVRRARYVLEEPKPDVLLWDFAASSITYRVRFWIEDFENDDVTQDSVRRSIYYEMSRQGIDIPFPIQIEYSKEVVVEEPEKRTDRFLQMVGAVPVLAALPLDGRRAIAQGAVERLYGNGEMIVKEGEPGESLFIVCRGQVAITIGKGHEVARTKAGGYFGEMSLLTGEPRSATVKAVGDCTVLEISADVFRAYVTDRPDVIDQLASAAASRRRELDQSRAAASHVTEIRLSLAARMRKFFGLE
jgi:small-conductance mechanosensitive channel/CRP-like cAMP-binding protein